MSLRMSLRQKKQNLRLLFVKIFNLCFCPRLSIPIHCQMLYKKWQSTEPITKPPSNTGHHHLCQENSGILPNLSWIYTNTNGPISSIILCEMKYKYCISKSFAQTLFHGRECCLAVPPQESEKAVRQQRS